MTKEEVETLIDEKIRNTPLLGGGGNIADVVAEVLNFASEQGGTTTLKYVALLTQSGTSAPVATVLENTIGPIVWSRTDTGYYLGTRTGAFDLAKTVAQVGSAFDGDPATALRQSIYVESVDDIAVATATTSGLASDDILLRTFVKIEVYP